MMHLTNCQIRRAMPTGTFEKALMHLDEGDLEAVRRLARPLVLDHDNRGDGLYLLGRAYQVEGKPHVALYLLEEASKRVAPPDTPEYLEQVQAEVAASGWTEDFTDRGHTVCARCRLYYRGEYASCPYCSELEAVGQAGADFEAMAGEADLGWEEDLLDKADRIGRGVLDRAREIADSRSVKEMSDRARALGKEAVERARTFSGREDVREAVQRAKRAGSDASESARKVLDTDTARSVQESTRETGSSFVQHVRDFVQEERSRYESADEGRRRAIVIKWIAVGIALLIALRVLAWIL